MERSKSNKPRLGKLSSVRRKAVSATQEEWVKSGLLYPDESLPLVIQPAIDGVDLLAWARSNKELIENQVLKHGAVLFRGFDIKTVSEFHDFIAAVSPGAIEYRFRASPRSQVGENIYTSTDYPADQSIFLHNEHSYSPVFPLRLFFFCITPADEQGETPLGDCRQILKSTPSDIRERFIEKKILYVRNYNDGFGLPWQTVFQTTEKSGVEEYCRKHNIEFEWKGGDRLRTRQVGPATVRHPRTGEEIWFNHGTFFHVSTLPPEIREGILANFKEEDLPTNTYYGDGTPIEPSVLEELRGIYQQEAVIFPWQTGDLLILDNMLAVHGRRPYVGQRKVVVGMAEPTSWKDVQIV